MDLEQKVHGLIDLALKEDIRSGDITTLACICENATTSAKLIIKANHLSYLSTNSKNVMAKAVEQVKLKHPGMPVEIEVEELDRLEEALNTEADAVMLINMTTEEAKKCVEKAKKTSKKVYIESGGTITLDTVRAYAETGVNGISVGDLTHSIQALDIRMRLDSSSFIRYTENF